MIINGRGPTKHYVLGFAFTENMSHVLMVKKANPEWQRNLLNGIGGKIEDGESPSAAMHREAMEEAGLDLPWAEVGLMRHNQYDALIFIYQAMSADVSNYHNNEPHEPKLLLPVSAVKYYPHISNIPTLLKLLTGKHRPINFQLIYS